jgi:D-alanine-D-alanine ligase
MQDVLSQVAFLQKHMKEQIFPLPYSGNVCSFIESLKQADVAWNLFESFGGQEEKQYLGAALFEMAGVRYTGSTLEALVLCADKLRVRALLKEVGVPVPMGEGASALWIIKPAKFHGSVGITDASVVSDITNIPAGYFVEAYIDGEEYAVSLLDKGNGLEAIAAARMDFINYPKDKPRILGFDAKWNEDSEDYQRTVRSFDVNAGLARELSSLAEKSATALGLAGFARIDFRVDKSGQPFVIDVNPNPGLGEDSGFVAACRYAGIDVDFALGYIVENAFL